MEKIREFEVLQEIAEKYYQKLGIELSVDGKINMAEVAWVLIMVVKMSFGFIIRNHGMSYGFMLLSEFISNVVEMITDGIKDNDGADGTESRTGGIERGSC